MDANLNTLLILRVVATFAVVFGHAASFFTAFDATQWPNSPYLQSMAVTVFFAVSGFTIAWVVDTRQSVRFWRFAYDRYMRLAIPLLPILLLFWIAESVFYGSEHQYAGSLSIGSFLGNIVFLQNIAGLGVPPFGTNRPLWTISIEFWTYIAFGGVLLGFRFRSIGALAAATLATVFLIPYVWEGRGEGLPLVWIAGAVFYHTLKYIGAPAKGWLFVIFPILAITLCLLRTPKFWPAGGEYSHLYNALLFILFSLTMMIGMIIPFPKKIMQFIEPAGKCAYTVYLSHYPIQMMLWKSGVLDPGPVSALAVTAISIFGGWALSLPFEQRYKGIRDEFIRLPVSAILRLRPRPSIVRPPTRSTE
jgi:peptidoglycan/LPS O-acetylase OafA/YrhL